MWEKVAEDATVRVYRPAVEQAPLCGSVEMCLLLPCEDPKAVFRQREAGRKE